jgi:hypothetical protein
VALAAALCAEPAVAAVPDAACPGPPTSFLPISGDQRAAQWFLAHRYGTLVSAQVVIDKQSAGADFQVQVLRAEDDGIVVLPVNEILSAARIPDASVPLGISTQTVSLNAPVSESFPFALVVTRPGAGVAGVGMRNSDPCPGQVDFSGTQNGEWVEGDPDSDLIFNVTVEPTNRFAIHDVFQRKITVITPGPGLLEGHDATPVKGKGRQSLRLVRDVQTTERLSGYSSLPMRLTHFGRRALRENRRLKARVAVTYTPNGGQPNTLQVMVPLRIPKR